MSKLPLGQHYHEPVGSLKENWAKGNLRPVLPVTNVPIYPGMDFTVLKVRCFKETFLRGSEGALVNSCNTRDRFQVGIPMQPLGLSM